MSKVIVTESYLEDIGDAIRSKLGGTDTYTPAEMAGAISQIHGEPVLEVLSVTENDTYNPPSGKDGFSQAIVNVPNSYAAGDEGKVVSNGALVAQTSDTVTENGTYDTTLNNEIVVNVAGGGGGQQINPFSGSTVTLYHSTNVTVADSLVDNAGTMEMECNVTANNSYEGFNIELNNLVADTPYEMTFDFQFINAGFYNSYGRGYKVTATADTNYSVYTNWERNLDANNNVQSEKLVFVATGTKMYLSFNISDLQNGSPSFEITNFKIKTFGGGSARLYTNGHVYANDAQITNVTGFTKVYDTSKPFGNYGSKIDTRLDETDESAIATFMSGGWNANGMPYYDYENQIGAYGGFTFGQALNITKAKFWLGRYSGQNKSLNVTIQYLDENNTWQDIKTFEVSTGIPYPVNVFTCVMNVTCYGVRWIHKEEPQKSSSNNISFAGMTLYEGVGNYTDVFIPPASAGLVEIPTGYDGFGTLYIP